MSIRTKLKASGIITICLALMVGFTAVLSSRNITKAEKKERFSSRVIKDVSDLSSLSYSYLLLRHERPEMQWLIKHSSLEKVLSEHIVESPEEQTLLVRLRANHEQLKHLFDSVSAQANEPRKGEDAFSMYEELNEGVAAQLMARSEMMANDASQLGRLSARQIDTARRVSLILVLASAVLLIFSAALTTFLLSRSIGRSIGLLAQGAKRIADGDLDYRVAVSGDDEISSFSESFNEMAAKLKESYGQLERRANQLARLSSELTLAEQRERRRLSEILHDHLQQILVGAKINSEILCASIGPEQQKIAVEVSRLINHSLQTSRSLTAELSPPILQQGSLSATLQWLSRWMSENQGFTVELESDTSIDPEKEDVTILLFQSVRELLLNAVKHAGVKSVRVKMSRDGGNSCRVDVIDEGPGIDPDAMWEKARDGTRFGLFSIKERMELMGGRLEIQSSPGKGATFSLFTPLEMTRSGDEISTQKSIAQPQKAVTSGEQIRILLVDDHTVVRQGLATLLNLHSDIEIVGEAADGEEAVEKARKLQPDVILMDISMPKMNGIEATRIISSEFPHIRIIGLSMHQKDDQAARMIEAGASGYCTKDGETDMLLSAIRGGSNSLALY